MYCNKTRFLLNLSILKKDFFVDGFYCMFFLAIWRNAYSLCFLVAIIVLIIMKDVIANLSILKPMFDGL